MATVHNLSYLVTFNPYSPNRNKSHLLSRLLKCLSSIYGKQCVPRSDCSLFPSMLHSSVMLGNYLQQTTSADNIFRCIFILGALRVKDKLEILITCPGTNINSG